MKYQFLKMFGFTLRAILRTYCQKLDCPVVLDSNFALDGVYPRSQIDRGDIHSELSDYLIVVRFETVALEAAPPPDAVAVVVTILGALRSTATSNVIGG